MVWYDCKLAVNSHMTRDLLLRCYVIVVVLYQMNTKSSIKNILLEARQLRDGGVKLLEALCIAIN